MNIVLATPDVYYGEIYDFSKKHFENLVEHALRASNKPIRVAEYRLITKLPDKLKGNMPTKEAIIQSLKKIKRLGTNEE